MALQSLALKAHRVRLYLMRVSAGRGLLPAGLASARVSSSACAAVGFFAAVVVCTPLKTGAGATGCAGEEASDLVAVTSKGKVIPCPFSRA